MSFLVSSRAQAPRKHLRRERNRRRAVTALSVGVALLALNAIPNCVRAAEAEKLFVATSLTEAGAFTEGIEGPACDAHGNVYAVNFARQQTIGKVTPDGKAALFVELPGKSTGNGIRFDRGGAMFVADYVGHNVLRIDPVTRSITIFAHSDEMNQPNDLAMAADGTLYASDPNWKEGSAPRRGPRRPDEAQFVVDGRGSDSTMTLRLTQN